MKNLCSNCALSRDVIWADTAEGKEMFTELPLDGNPVFGYSNTSEAEEVAW